MDAAAVGGAFLSAFLQVLFDRLTSPEVLGFFKTRNLNDGLLKKLKTVLICVNGLLDDAEGKQITKPAVRDWLDELKDSVYVADDCLDEIAYEALRSELEAGCKTNIEQMRKFFSSLSPFKNEIETKLEKVLDRLEYLVSQQNALGLIMIEGFGKNPSSQKIPTTSLVDEAKIYGRDDDKEAIIELLLDAENSSELCVIPIVGLGGIGKTTLAQHVYSDSRVQGWFDLKGWICVSEEFDVLKVTKDILEAVCGKAYSDTKTLDQIQLSVRDKLMGKRFLLVLDDVWNDKYCKWHTLLKPLMTGAKGSKIIVTTRNRSVAELTGTISIHHLKKLSTDDCWFLFLNHAFHDGNFIAYPHLEAIGRQIVKRCDGLPLAAKVIGGLLRSKPKTVKEWQHILNSNLWDLLEDDIVPALRLSYSYLPSQWKRCFAYCAIFSKDYRYARKDLVCLWMAEGFLTPSGGNMKELGDKYFDELISRSFFQQLDSNISLFVMHDLIHDLARSVSRGFCFMLEGVDSCKVSEKTRHLSYKGLRDLHKMVEGIHNARYLRTFAAADTWEWFSLKKVEDEVMHYFLSKFKHLRVLTLTSNNMNVLPESIGNLKHLRYLDLSFTSIERLHDIVTTLYNLQTLYLFSCKWLVELPTNFARLINLCHLDIRYTKVHEMSPQMSELRRLQILTNFVLLQDSGYSIKVLGKIQQVRELCICNLQNVVNIQDASEADVKGKRELRKLELKWYGDTKNTQHERNLLDKLEPPTNLMSLCIAGYNGTGFPNWLGDSSFSNMVHLELDGFKYCTSLPPLGQLAALRVLFIRALNGIIVVGPEFYGSCTSSAKPFESLEMLTFESLPQWEEWIHCTGAFPQLQNLCIKECPKLSSMPEGGLPPSVSSLNIFQCPLLEKRCERGIGEDWPMISHILNVQIS